MSKQGGEHEGMGFRQVAEQEAPDSIAEAEAPVVAAPSAEDARRRGYGERPKALETPGHARVPSDVSLRRRRGCERHLLQSSTSRGAKAKAA